MSFPQIDDVLARFDNLEARLADPEIAADHRRYTELAKEHAHLADLVGAFRQWKALDQRQADAQELLGDSDPEMASMAQEELKEIDGVRSELEDEIRRLLIPKDPNEGRNVMLEIRAGTGGDEASLFAADLFRMYSRYAETSGWKVQMLESSPTEQGGFREVIAVIKGKEAWTRLKYEAGTHRVQRVPSTETQGRIHTSAATVAVLPEAEEVDVSIDPQDLRIDVFRASGPGGQSVNTTDSAVRIIHLPTNLTVSCQDEKSQHKNKARAMQILMTRLLDLETRKAQEARAETRRGQVGTGDRSEKIRTYNFPQNRISDHRAGITRHDLDRVIAGELTGLLDEVGAWFEAELLKGDVA